MESKLNGLRKFNLLMAFLHFAQGVAMLIVSSGFSLPIITSYLKFNPQTQSLVSDPKTWVDLKIGPAVATFLFISALAHLLVSTVFNKWYNENLARGINYARWIEYFFSSSIMIVIISMLVGIYDISALIPIFLVNGAMILFGWMMELHNLALRQSTTKTNWTSFIFGCIAGAAPWIVIALYLFSPGSDSHPPTFVYWIFFSIFIFFNCFAINQILQYKKVGPWRDYLFGERMYIILSLVAKSLLAWQVFAGTLRP